MKFVLKSTTIQIILLVSCIPYQAQGSAILPEEERKEEYPMYQERDLRKIIASLPPEISEQIESLSQPTFLHRNASITSTEISAPSDILSLAISSDGLSLVTGCSNSNAYIWDIPTGILAHTLQGHTASILSLAVSPGIIVTGSQDATAKIWDIATRTLQHTLVGHVGPVPSATISKDEQFILTGGLDHTARLWESATGTLIQTFANHQAPVTSAAIDPNNRFIITASGNSARIWNIETGALERTLAGHTDPVNAVTISGDGQFIITGANDNTARVWNTKTGKLLYTLEGHNSPVTTVAISHSNTFLLTGSDDQTVCIWDATTGMLQNRFIDHQGKITSVAISSDDQYIFTAHAKTVTIRQLQPLPEITTTVQKKHALYPAFDQAYSLRLQAKATQNFPQANLTKMNYGIELLTNADPSREDLTEYVSRISRRIQKEFYEGLQIAQLQTAEEETFVSPTLKQATILYAKAQEMPNFPKGNLEQINREIVQLQNTDPSHKDRINKISQHIQKLFDDGLQQATQEEEEELEKTHVISLALEQAAILHTQAQETPNFPKGILEQISREIVQLQNTDPPHKDRINKISQHIQKLFDDGLQQATQEEELGKTHVISLALEQATILHTQAQETPNFPKGNLEQINRQIVQLQNTDPSHKDRINRISQHIEKLFSDGLRKKTQEEGKQEEEKF